MEGEYQKDKLIFIIYLPGFLDTGLPRRNVHEQDS